MPPLPPDWRRFAQAMENKRPDRLPLYEHIISPAFMERATGASFAHHQSADGDLDAFMKPFCAFWRDEGYDTVSYEVCTTSVLPGPHAITGGRGPLQTRADIEAFPWAHMPGRFRQFARPFFDALRKNMPDGMRAVGGVGNGVFELAEDLVGLECLPLLAEDDPEAHALLYRHIGDFMLECWKWTLAEYGDLFVAARFGDDLGFRSSTLTSPAVIRGHIVPQYRRVIGLIHAAGKPFIYHSCGCIFGVMDDMLALGINAKHSNEDAIAPFGEWIRRYGQRIALLGGLDLDFLCRATPGQVYETTLRQGREWRQQANGFALGTGNSIPDYIPVDNYRAMVRAGREIRES